MENTTPLKASVRTETGKGPARRLRQAGLIPGVCYGKEQAPVQLAVDPKELTKQLKGPFGLNAIFRLETEGEGISNPTVRVVEYQRDPVRRNITHVDFQAISADQVLSVKVPLKLVGTPKGLGVGGSLKQLVYDIKVKGNAAAIPTHIEADVSDLDVGDIFRITTLPLPEGLELIFDGNFGIATVFLSRSARSAASKA